VVCGFFFQFLDDLNGFSEVIFSDLFFFGMVDGLFHKSLKFFSFYQLLFLLVSGLLTDLDFVLNHLL
jgi:hypothetical protein